MPRVSLHWFRRDLRLTDNTALSHAVRASDQVVPVYILSDWKQKHDWTGGARQQFLCGCLESLSKNLSAKGSRLILRQGRAEAEIERLIKETSATAVHTNRDPDPFGKAMERKVAAVCARLGVEFHSHKDCVLHEANEVLTDEGNPYRVYTPYARKWLSMPKDSVMTGSPELGPAIDIPSDERPSLETWGLSPSAARIQVPGEHAARLRMKRFTADGIIEDYAQTRDTPAVQGTSRLSQDLRFGLISIRELYHRCAASTSDSAAKFVKELAWREFYMAVLHHWPEVLETDFNSEFRSVPWESREDYFQAWQRGLTGFPIVDAGIRELLGTGFMHNRVRMITAMFLTKDLHVHWRLGESFFMQHLVDGEISSNNGGWQWSAGTGADAAPYFRIQNPWTQSKRFDPQAVYIRRWIPELNGVPVEKLMSPALSPLHPDYPLPIVDHAAERMRTLERFKLARRNA